MRSIDLPTIFYFQAWHTALQCAKNAKHCSRLHLQYRRYTVHSSVFQVMNCALTREWQNTAAASMGVQ